MLPIFAGMLSGMTGTGTASGMAGLAGNMIGKSIMQNAMNPQQGQGVMENPADNELKRRAVAWWLNNKIPYVKSLINQ